MQTSQQHKERGKVVSDLFGYIPAVLKEYKPFWCIEYSVLHPATGQMTQVREKVSGYKTRYGVREARKLLRVAVNRLNLKLSQGYNPFFVHEDSRLYERLTNVIDKFITEKTRELRPNTLRSYKSMIGKELCEWAQQNYPIITASTFTKSIAVRYMDYIADKGKSNTSYNNTKKCASSFFSWCVEKCYAKENPFEHIKPKRKEQKKTNFGTARSARTNTRVFTRRKSRGYANCLEFDTSKSFAPQRSERNSNQTHSFERKIYTCAFRCGEKSQ
jgi:hypothetical protein